MVCACHYVNFLSIYVWSGGVEPLQDRQALPEGLVRHRRPCRHPFRSPSLRRRCWWGTTTIATIVFKVAAPSFKITKDYVVPNAWANQMSVKITSVSDRVFVQTLWARGLISSFNDVAAPLSKLSTIRRDGSTTVHAASHCHTTVHHIVFSTCTS